MKLMKCLLAIALGAALLCPMTVYAGQTEEALALYNQVQEKSRFTTDMNAYYDFKIKVGGTMLQNKGLSLMDMRLEMNIKTNRLADPDQMRYMAYSRTTGPDNEQITFSMHYLDGYCYMDMLGQKVKYSMIMADMVEQSMASANAFDVSTDIMRDLNLWDEDENKVIGFTIDDTKMDEYLQTILSPTGLVGMTDGAGTNLRNMRGEYVANPSGDMIKVRLKMDMDMTMEGQTATVNLDGDTGIADPGQPVDVPVPNIAGYTDMTAAAAANQGLVAVSGQDLTVWV